MPRDPSHPEPSPKPSPRPRGATIIAAGLLLTALALVVLYTGRGAFLSPVAMVVIAAIGLAALLLQALLHPDSSSPRRSSRLPLWLNVVGVASAIAPSASEIDARRSRGTAGPRKNSVRWKFARRTHRIPSSLISFIWFWGARKRSVRAAIAS